MEPATRIERATCGLRIVPTPLADNVCPQQTTMQEVADKVLDGASLSCPGSSVVAEGGQDDCKLNPLIKSPVDEQP